MTDLERLDQEIRDLTDLLGFLTRLRAIVGERVAGLVNDGNIENAIAAAETAGILRGSTIAGTERNAIAQVAAREARAAAIEEAAQIAERCTGRLSVGTSIRALVYR